MENFNLKSLISLLEGKDITFSKKGCASLTTTGIALNEKLIEFDMLELTEEEKKKLVALAKVYNFKFVNKRISEILIENLNVESNIFYEERLKFLSEAKKVIDHKGENNPNYRGSIQNLSVRGWHYRVQMLKGKASEYKCAHCGNKNASQESNQWAFTGPKNATPRSIRQFIPLCKSCHSKKDAKGDNLRKNKK